MDAMDVFYMTYMTQNGDEAVSLTNYLNEHGVFASQSDTNEVSCPMTDPAIAAKVYDLKKTWQLFWDYSDSGLFGLPCYTKP